MPRLVLVAQPAARAEPPQSGTSPAPTVAPALRRGDTSREMLTTALSLSEEEQERRVARALRLAGVGVHDLAGGAESSMGALRRRARAATIAASTDAQGVDARPSAADTKAHWAAAPAQMRVSPEAGAAFVSPPRREGPEIHPRADAVLIAREWHLVDGCADCEAGRDCYIHALQQHIEAFKVPFKPGLRPKSLLDPGRASWKPADMTTVSGRALASAVGELLEADIFESVDDPADLRQCAAISGVHVAAKQSLRVTPEEAPAVDAYDMTEMARLAEMRAIKVVKAMTAAAGGGVWTREMVEGVMAAERDGVIKWRLVVGLHRTVNDLVEDWSFRYVDFEEEFSMAVPAWSVDDRIGRNDFAKGFYSVEIAEEDRCMFCIRDPRDPTGKRILRYKRLPMGFKLAPALYSGLTSEVARHFNASSHGRLGALYRFYVDDMGTKARGAVAAAAAQAYARAEAPKARMLWGTGAGKDDEMAQANTLVGRIFDSNVDGAPMVRVAGKALFTALVDLAVLRLASSAAPEMARLPVEWLRSMAGRVSWVSQATYAARLHTSSLWYAANHAPVSGSGMVSIGRIGGLLSDAAWFARQATAGKLRGERRVRPDQLAAGAVVRVWSDACGGESAGAGALCNGRGVYHAFSGGERNWSIQAKELAPVVAAAEAWGAEWRGKVVIFYTDNLGNAYGINRGKAVLGTAQKQLQRLYELADEHGFEFLAVWLPRRANGPADAVSKAGSLEHAGRAAVEWSAVASASDVASFECNYE